MDLIALAISTPFDCGLFGIAMTRTAAVFMVHQYIRFSWTCESLRTAAKSASWCASSARMRAVDRYRLQRIKNAAW
jgi:hypothetical protein